MTNNIQILEAIHQEVNSLLDRKLPKYQRSPRFPDLLSIYCGLRVSATSGLSPYIEIKSVWDRGWISPDGNHVNSSIHTYRVIGTTFGRDGYSKDRTQLADPKTDPVRCVLQGTLLHCKVIQRLINIRQVNTQP